MHLEGCLRGICSGAEPFRASGGRRVFVGSYTHESSCKTAVCVLELKEDALVFAGEVLVQMNEPSCGPPQVESVEEVVDARGRLEGLTVRRASGEREVYQLDRQTRLVRVE
jgi:hypothetical protein